MKNSYNKMLCLDIFMNSLTHEEYQKNKYLLKDSQDNHLPIISAEFHIENLNSFPLKKDLVALFNFNKYFNWQNNLKSILEEKNYEALVLTDTSKNILWVNDGFSKMTGYSKEFAVSKTPKILQGKGTLKSDKKEFERKIAKNKPFKEIILNYRKDNTPYKCEVSIFPLYNKKKTTHFLALEREVV